MSFQNTVKEMIFLVFIFILFKNVTSSLKQQTSNICYNQKWSSQLLSINIKQQYVKTKLGFPMIIDRKDQVVSGAIRNFGVWQIQLSNLIQNIVKKGDKVLNLGSQTGMQAVLIAKKISSTGKLYIFQPFINSYNIMRKNFFLNNLQDIVETYNIGASNQFAMGRISIHYFNTGEGRIQNLEKYNSNAMMYSKSYETSTTASHQIIVAPVDKILPEDLVLDFALIDVQSMQIQAIDGMKKIIDRSPNLIIMTQWQFGIFKNFKNKNLFESVVNYLFQKGYKIYYIPPRGNCALPQFQQKKTVESLIMELDANVLMIPPTKELPKY